MSTGLTQAVVIDGLRRWARGAYAEEAAVELLVRAFGGQYASTGYRWIRQCDRPGWFWLDGERLSNATSVPGSVRAVLAVVGALVSGAPLTDLDSLLVGLDRPNLELILAALAHAAGSHEQIDVNVKGDLLVYRRLGPVLAWPTPAGRAVA